MSHLMLIIGAVIGLQCCLSACESSDLLSEALESSSEQQERGFVYAPKRSLLVPAPEGGLFSLDSRERRAAGSGMGSSFIRFGRAEATLGAVSQPHTRSDIIIRYGRDGLNDRLVRLRQERMRRLARLALICAAKNQEERPAGSAEEKILREICKDAPLHPTVPDFV